jgi:hypothetical protein
MTPIRFRQRGCVGWKGRFSILTLLYRGRTDWLEPVSIQVKTLPVISLEGLVLVFLSQKTVPHR